MNLKELKNIASAYTLETRLLEREGLFLLDMKSRRYHKVCRTNEVESLDKDHFLQEIRKFTNKLHGRG